MKGLNSMHALLGLGAALIAVGLWAGSMSMKLEAHMAQSDERMQVQSERIKHLGALNATMGAELRQARVNLAEIRGALKATNGGTP